MATPLESPAYCLGCEHPLLPYTCQDTGRETLACPTETCPERGCQTCLEIGRWFIRVNVDLDNELGRA